MDATLGCQVTQGEGLYLDGVSSINGGPKSGFSAGEDRSNILTVVGDLEAAYPCLLARLWVVFHKDCVRGRNVESTLAGLSLA